MIASGDKDLAKEYRDQYVHTLGNLTLSGYNQKLSNLSFEQKRDRKDRNGKDIGYKNGLYLNRELGSMDSWSIEKIKDRTKFLVNKVEFLRVHNVKLANQARLNC